VKASSPVTTEVFGVGAIEAGREGGLDAGAALEAVTLGDAAGPVPPPEPQPVSAIAGTSTAIAAAQVEIRMYSRWQIVLWY